MGDQSATHNILRIFVSTTGHPKPQQASRALVKLIFLSYSVKRLGQTSIEVYTPESLRDIKNRLLCNIKAKDKADGGNLLPGTYDLIPWNYPIADQRTQGIA